jgi:hypothetical protein
MELFPEMEITGYLPKWMSIANATIRNEPMP